MSIPTPFRVLVTGATGLLGSHTARTLMAEGHQVRALVRNPDKAAKVFGKRADALEVVKGDIGDLDSVRRALDGCTAVIHCAAVVAVDSVNDQTTLIETNVTGVRNVIGTALDTGLERVIHVSSIAPLFRSDGVPVTESSELQPSKRAYSQSKMEADLYARDLQAEGKPVKIIYPGAIIGPDDPGLTESMRSIQIFSQVFLPLTDSGMQFVDVRDVAQGLSRIVADEPGTKRYLAAGNFVSWAELASLLTEITGTRPPAHRVPAWAFRLAGRACDLARTVVPIELPLSLESATYVTCWNPIKNSEDFNRLGVTFRDIRSHSPIRFAGWSERGISKKERL